MKQTLVVPDGGEIHVFPSSEHTDGWMKYAEASFEKTKHMHNARGLRYELSRPVAVLGIFCEYVSAYGLGQPKSDDLSIDAGPYQIKATEYETGRLAVTPRHLNVDFRGDPVPEGTIYILITARRGGWTLRGWATREELLAAPLDDMMNPQRPLMHVLTQKQLHGMDTLPR